MTASALIIVWGATMVAGYFVGAHKGRARDGVIWTLLLGFIGLIVVLLMGDSAQQTARIDAELERQLTPAERDELHAMQAEEREARQAR